MAALLAVLMLGCVEQACSTASVGGSTRARSVATWCRPLANAKCARGQGRGAMERHMLRLRGGNTVAPPQKTHSPTVGMLRGKKAGERLTKRARGPGSAKRGQKRSRPSAQASASADSQATETVDASPLDHGSHETIEPAHKASSLGAVSGRDACWLGNGTSSNSDDEVGTCAALDEHANIKSDHDLRHQGTALTGHGNEVSAATEEAEEEEEEPSWAARMERRMRGDGDDDDDQANETDESSSGSGQSGGSENGNIFCPVHDPEPSSDDPPVGAVLNGQGDPSGQKDIGERSSIGAELRAVLEGLQNSNQTLDSTGYESLIKVFARRNAPQDVMHLWDDLHSRGLKPTFSTTELVLEVCQQHKLHARGIAAGNKTIAEGVHVDRPLYLKVLTACVALKEYDTIMNLFSEMRDAGIAPGQRIHAIFFEACLHLRAADAALKELTVIRLTTKKPPSRAVLNRVIEICLHAGKEAEAEPLIQEVKERLRFAESKTKLRDEEREGAAIEVSSSDATMSIETALAQYRYQGWGSKSGAEEGGTDGGAGGAEEEGQEETGEEGESDLIPFDFANNS